MIQIRPISDLRNKFTEIEGTINTGQPVYLTKNGYGAMVVMSLDKYAELVDEVEFMLDEADYAATVSDVRYSHDEVFTRLKEGING